MIVALLTTSKNMSTDKPRKEGMKGKGVGKERRRRLKETQSVIRGLGRRGGGVSKKHNQLLGGREGEEEASQRNTISY